jgi:hypothetical protein
MNTIEETIERNKFANNAAVNALRIYECLPVGTVHRGAFPSPAFDACALAGVNMALAEEQCSYELWEDAAQSWEECCDTVADLVAANPKDIPGIDAIIALAHTEKEPIVPAVEDTQDGAIAVLNRELGSHCGLNADWSCEAWHVAGEKLGGKGIYIIIDESNSDCLSVAARDYSKQESDPDHEVTIWRTFAFRDVLDAIAHAQMEGGYDPDAEGDESHTGQMQSLVASKMWKLQDRGAYGWGDVKCSTDDGPYVDDWYRTREEARAEKRGAGECGTSWRVVRADTPSDVDFYT